VHRRAEPRDHRYRHAAKLLGGQRGFVRSSFPMGAPGGAVAPAGICTEGEDFDPGTEEPLAHWHACAAMADKLQYILIAAVDDIGGDPVETVGFRASVSFY